MKKSFKWTQPLQRVHLSQCIKTMELSFHQTLHQRGLYISLQITLTLMTVHWTERIHFMPHKWQHGNEDQLRTCFFLYLRFFYCVSQNHIQSTYTYTYSLSPEVSRNTNLIIAQFICYTVQRQVSCNRQIITLTYIMFISTNHSMCTLCHITDTDDHRLSYNSDHFIRNCSYLFWEIYIASKTSILFFNICKNFKKNILLPFLFV